MNTLTLILIFIAMQRLGELVLARRNTERLRHEGAIEIGAGHYWLFIALHGSWLLAIALTTPADAAVNGWLIVALVLLQAGRIWVIATLGRFWTTRIITLPGQPLIRSGPYRFLRHPNYWIVAGEIAVLPMIFNNWRVALIWSLLNAVLLAWRIHIENKALSDRRYLDMPIP